MPSLTAEVKIQNKLGLHARPAAMLVQTTNKFKSEILIKKNDMEINAKSILGIMMLAAEYGSSLVLTVSGKDAEEALSAVRELFPLKPADIIRELKLLDVPYSKTAAYGHFGREEEGFTWEHTDKIEALKSYFNK